MTWNHPHNQPSTTLKTEENDKKWISKHRTRRADYTTLPCCRPPAGVLDLSHGALRRRSRDPGAHPPPLRRPRHLLRRPLLRHRLPRRHHLRLRHRRLRRRHVDGRLLGALLPGGVPPDARRRRRRARQQLLPLRQPAAHRLHVVALRRRPRHHVPRLARHRQARPPRVHARGGGRHRRRRHGGRLRGGPRHGDPRARPARRRRRVRQPGRAALPVGDGAAVTARRVQQRVPALRQRRGVRGAADQLRRGEDRRRVGVAGVARRRGRPGRVPRRRRGLPPRDAKQPRPARRGTRQGESSPEQDPRQRRRRSRRRAGRHRRRRQVQGDGEARAGADAHPAPLPAAAGHGGDDPLLPADDRDQRHRVLRAGAPPHRRDGRERGAARGGHQTGGRRRRDAGIHARRRPVRPPHAIPRRRRPDGGLPAAHRVHHGGAARRRRRAEPGERAAADRPRRRLRRRLRVVVGATGLAGAERDLPAGGEVGGAEHRRGGELPAHDGGGAVVLGHALPHEGRHLLLLRGVAGRHDRLRLPPLAGDQGVAHRAGREAVGAPLVLEEVRRHRLRRR
uniref:Uncharacterized protein n=1 Tax=Oryza glumipatula TaxID=40148 RepID=A0A0E0AFJ9_9ORYZ